MFEFAVGAPFRQASFSSIMHWHFCSRAGSRQKSRRSATNLRTYNTRGCCIIVLSAHYCTMLGEVGLFCGPSWKRTDMHRTKHAKIHNCAKQMPLVDINAYAWHSPERNCGDKLLWLGRKSRRRIGRKFGRNFLCIFVLHLLCRATHQNISHNSSQFITPCLVRTLVAEISKFISASFWGLGRPINARNSRVYYVYVNLWDGGGWWFEETFWLPSQTRLRTMQWESGCILVKDRSKSLAIMCF